MLRLRPGGARQSIERAAPARRTCQCVLKLFDCLIGLVLLQQEVCELFSRRDDRARRYGQLLESCSQSEFLVLTLRISSSGAPHGRVQRVDAFLILPRHPAVSHWYPDCAEPQHEHPPGQADPSEES